MKREWITRKGVFVPPAPTGRIVIVGPGKRSTDARGTKPGETTPELRVLDGHGGKTSLAVCGALSTQRLRLALAAGDCAGAGSGGRGQEGSTQQFCARVRGGGAVFGEGLARIGARGQLVRGNWQRRQPRYRRTRSGHRHSPG